MYTSLHLPAAPHAVAPFLAKILGEEGPGPERTPEKTPGLTVKIEDLKDDAIGRIIEELQAELAKRHRKDN